MQGQLKHHAIAPITAAVGLTAEALSARYREVALRIYRQINRGRLEVYAYLTCLCVRRGVNPNSDWVYAHRYEGGYRRAKGRIGLYWGLKSPPAPDLQGKYGNARTAIQKGGGSTCTEGGEGVRQNPLQNAQYLDKSILHRRIPPLAGLGAMFLT